MRGRGWTRAGLVALASWALLVLASCAPYDPYPAGSREFREWAREVDGVDDVRTQRMGSAFPFTGYASATVDVGPQRDGDALAAVLEELASFEGDTRGLDIDVDVTYRQADYAATFRLDLGRREVLDLVLDPDVAGAATLLTYEESAGRPVVGAVARYGVDFLTAADRLLAETVARLDCPDPDLTVSSANGWFVLDGAAATDSAARRIFEQIRATHRVTAATVHTAFVRVTLADPLDPAALAALEALGGQYPTVEVTAPPVPPAA
ncbi:hypothetical protein ACWFNE_08595 [Cellulomonas sp. NPDC055163]